MVLPGILSYVAGTVLIVMLVYLIGLLGSWYFVRTVGKKQPGWCQNRACYTKGTQLGPEAILQNQFGYCERHGMKYLSLKAVWPESLHPPATESTPLIFCIIPHGVLPLGVMAYPFFSKVFNSRICHWTTAPIVTKMPIIKDIVKATGIIPAKKEVIENMLIKKEESVGVVLDGIAGMFNDSDDSTPLERGHVMERKGIVKIALKAGVPIVPVYQFGVTSLWTIMVDPFGILQRISIYLNISFVPFYGRWGWPLGPPARHPVLLAFGDPIMHPRMENDTIGKEVLDQYHAKVMAGFQNVFDTHKRAYGWDNKTLKLV